MARGGRRSGTPGRSYSNRSDLNTVRQLPVKAAPGQPYGEAGQQRAAQQQVPRGNGDLTTAPTPAPSQDDVLAQAQAYTPPNVIPINAPTMLPGQHVMTAPNSAGPLSAPSPLLQGVALLNTLGADASPEVKALRDALAVSQANEAAP